MRETSPGAKYWGSRAASPSTKKTLCSSLAHTRSMAITMASGTRSTAIYRALGFCSAVSAVKRPLPQPSSRYTVSASGISSRQFPRRASGSEIKTRAQRSIRGIRLGFLLIRMGICSPHKLRFSGLREVIIPTRRVKSISKLFCIEDLIRRGFI